MSAPVAITDSTFKKEVLESPLPVVVDFWAEWCSPCKQIAPLLEELAREKNGQLKVAKLDIDSNPKTPTDYGVNGIPTLMLFHQGKETSRRVGAAPRSVVLNWIEQALATP